MGNADEPQDKPRTSDCLPTEGSARLEERPKREDRIAGDTAGLLVEQAWPLLLVSGGVTLKSTCAMVRLPVAVADEVSEDGRGPSMRNGVELGTVG